MAALGDETGMFTNISPEYIAELENEPPVPSVENQAVIA